MRKTREEEEEKEVVVVKEEEEKYFKLITTISMSNVSVLKQLNQQIIDSVLSCLLRPSIHEGESWHHVF